MKKIIAAWVLLAVILGYFNWSVWQNEMIRSNGRVVLLQLAPIDPRSLIQGDYMRLNYDFNNSLDENKLPHTGQLVFTVDQNGVGTVQGVYDQATSLQENQVLINYKQENWGQTSIGASNYFFEEGSGDYFNQAKYAEIRVDDSGTALLTGLRGDQLQPL